MAPRQADWDPELAERPGVVRVAIAADHYAIIIRLPSTYRPPRPLRAARNAARRIYDTRVGVDQLNATVAALAQQVEALRSDCDALVTAVDHNHQEAVEILRLIFYDDSRNRDRLWQLRETAAYAQAYEDPEPLVSVCIATYNNTELLLERALPSVLAQTYERIEVVVVGDGAAPEVERAVKRVGDQRVRYSNLTVRGPYPEAPQDRWFVAGGPPRNEATRLARGRWIASMDDDDESMPDRIELLLGAARGRDLEFCYGQIERRDSDGSMSQLCDFPPALGKVGLQAGIMHAGLRFIQAELGDALFRLPGDWSRIRRMMRVGVRIGMIPDVVVAYFPSLPWAGGSA